MANEPTPRTDPRLPGQPSWLTPPAELSGQVVVHTSQSRFYVARDLVKHPLWISWLGQHRKVSEQHEVTPFEIEYCSLPELAEMRRSTANRVDPQTRMQGVARAIWTDAAVNGVSDIHIKLTGRYTQILWRRYGEYREYHTLTDHEGRLLLRTIYASMADPGASETTLIEGRAQDARISRPEMIGTDLIQSIRVATTPTVDGMLMVLRLLGSRLKDESAPDPLHALGYEPFQIEIIHRLLEIPKGIIILSGVTNSGKSTALFEILRLRDRIRPYRHTVTIENPPEYIIEGATQIPIVNNTDDGEDDDQFKSGVKRTMRLDPNAIMIGEIRSYGTLKAAIDAADTGHPTFSTVHADGIFGTLRRLHLFENPVTSIPIDSNVLFNADLLLGIISQRLVATLCPHCSLPFSSQVADTLDQRLLERVRRLLNATGADPATIRFRGPGCAHPGCKYGLAGRTVVAEVERMTQDEMDLFREHGQARASEYWLGHDGFSRMAHAAAKVLRGKVDIRDAEGEVGPLEGETLANLQLALEVRAESPGRAGRIHALPGGAHDAQEDHRIPA
ncbi:type II secretion system protein E [mine drainage metagenome]|uniref:Type II secretion system protein E n=1 Tax=mine drainage metagenome TaxID=410659 RepID=T1C2S5_9ZZZZ